MIPLLCFAITAAAFYYIFHVPEFMVAGSEQTRVTYLLERKEAVYENLRDLNFESKAGKIPESVYQTMKNSLEEEAAAILAEISRLESALPPAATVRSKKGQKT